MSLVYESICRRFASGRRWCSRCRETGILLLLAGLIACQSSTRVGDRYYAAGRLPEAAAAFEVYLRTGQAKEPMRARTLYRLGAIYTDPNTSVHDPQRSRELLEQVVREYPDSAWATQARLLLELQETADRLRFESQAVRRQLADVELELAARRQRIDSLETNLEWRQREIEVLRDSIPPLEVEIRELIRNLAAKERELEQLEQLKAIDLDETPP